MNEIDKSLLKQVDNGLINRYSTRLKQFGNDPRTLGWDTQKNQWARFEVASKSIDMTGSSILDVGCGLGDFHHYLNQNNIRISEYIGLDINPDLIQHCRELDPETQYEEGNLLTLSPQHQSVDIVCIFGVLNFRFREINNETFAREMLTKAFKIARKAVVVDMLSTQSDHDYPIEDFVYYYEPSKMLDFAFTLTPHIQMRHDYRSIPQREFMLIMRKQPCE